MTKVTDKRGYTMKPFFCYLSIILSAVLTAKAAAESNPNSLMVIVNISGYGEVHLVPGNLPSFIEKTESQAIPSVTYTDSETGSTTIVGAPETTGYSVSFQPYEDKSGKPKAKISIDYSHLDGFENGVVEGGQVKLPKIFGCKDYVFVEMSVGSSASYKRCSASVRIEPRRTTD